MSNNEIDISPTKRRRTNNNTSDSPTSQVTSSQANTPKSDRRRPRTRPSQVPRRRHLSAAPISTQPAVQRQPASSITHGQNRHRSLRSTNPTSALQPPSENRQQSPEPIDHLTRATVGTETPSNCTWLPEISDIFKLQPPLIKHIPHQVRQEVTRSFTSTIWAYIRAEGPVTKTKAMTRIFLWPSAIILAVSAKNGPLRRKKRRYYHEHKNDHPKTHRYVESWSHTATMVTCERNRNASSSNSPQNQRTLIAQSSTQSRPGGGDGKVYPRYRLAWITPRER